jgi:hypothetical protein
MVFHVQVSVFDPAKALGWMFMSNPRRPTDISNHVGPFRIAINDDPWQQSPDWWQKWKASRPRDTFARFADGASNQFLIGERHIPISLIGQCGNNNQPERYSADCSYLSPGVWGVNSMGRSFYTWDGEKMLAKGPFDFDAAGPEVVVTHSYNFGSSHPEVCNFALGDGGSRSVAVMTPYSILAAFAQVNDGSAVSLP